MPANTSIDYVLSSINGKWTDVFAYYKDPSEEFVRWHYKSEYMNKWFGDLENIDPYYGYWIKVDEDVNLTVSGYSINNPLIPLEKGWNLVGWPILSTQEVFDLNIMGNVTDVFAYYDGNWHYKSEYLNKWFGDLSALEPGKGYWIKVDNSSLLKPGVSKNAAMTSVQSVMSQGENDDVCTSVTTVSGKLYEYSKNGSYEKFPDNIDMFVYQLTKSGVTLNEPILIGKGRSNGGDYHIGIGPIGPGSQTIKIVLKGFDNYTLTFVSCGGSSSKNINVYSPWFNYSWKYRKPIQIKNNFGENLNNYQVNLKIDTASLISQGKMKNDCSDIRFVYGGKELPYYVESGCNTQNTSIWIKVNLSAYEAKTIYIYYGNQNTTTKSDANSVFDFFDDFETMDTTKWNLWGSPQPYIYSSSIARINGDGYYHSGMTSKQIFNLSNLIFEAKEKNWPVSYNGRPRGWGISSKNSYGVYESSKTFVGFHEWCDYKNNCRKFYAPGYSNNFGTANDQYHISSIAAINRSVLKFFFDGSNVGNYSGNINYDKGYFELWAHDPDSYVDWIRIRKYSSQVPVYAVSNEQLNDWWNCSWNYRKKMSIVEKSGKEIKDYQIALNINTQSLISTGQLKQDCSDMRFIDNNKELPYYIEYGCNTSNTKVWIKINLSASQTKEIYIYYGNQNASNKSDPNSVFDFFDDFETINTTKWNTWGSPQPYIYSSSIARINGDGYYHSGMTSKQIFNLSNLIFEAKEKNWPVSYNGRPRGWGISSKNTYGVYESSTTFVGFYEWCDYKNNCRKFYAPGYSNNFGTANDQYHISSIAAINRSVLKFFFDGSNIGNYSGNINYDNGYFELWAHDPDSYADWVRVRKYVPLEPDVYVDNIQMMQTMYIPQEQQEYSSITVNVSIDDISITKKEELKEETENISNLTELQSNTSLVKTKLRGKMIEKVEINESEVLDKIENTSKLNELYVNKIFNESNESIRVIVKFKKNTTKQMEKIKGEKIKDDVISKIVDKNEMYQLLENEYVDSIEEDVKVNALMNDSYSVINYTVTFNNTEFNGSGIKVAVIDTGILHNSSLFPNICCEYDFVENDSYAQDENGHGTHVTSILSSNLEPRGIAPGITLVPIRALDASGGGYASDIIKAMYYAVEQNVSVISLSLGAINSPILTETTNEIVKNYNVTIVVAAGNYGPNSGTITSPGDAEYAISVGAIDKNNEIAYFSSRGPINGISKPDVVAPGVNVVTYSTNGLKGMSGTSASTPFVSGLAALLLQQNNNRTPTEIKEIIINNTVNLNCEINVCGYGKINIGKALFEKYGNKNNESNINEPLNNTENKTEQLNKSYSNSYEIKTINVTAGDMIIITYKMTNPLNETKFDVTIYGINESWAKYERKITLKENETKTERAFIHIPINSNNEALNITIVISNKAGIGHAEPIIFYVKKQQGKDEKIKDKIKDNAKI